MSRFIVTIEKKALQTATVQNIVDEIKAKLGKKADVDMEKDPTPNSRADQLALIKARVEECAGDVESLKDELQDWKDNLPENLQDGDKGSQLETAIDALDAVKDSIEEAANECDSVEFPGMY
jgi:nucleoid DNA-binding protein